MKLLNRLIAIEEHPRRGLMPVEWVMMAYLLATTLFIFITYGSRQHPEVMLTTRAQALGTTLLLWAVYRLRPCRLCTLLRMAGQMMLLGLWYPDTYELNRVFLNLDHIFAGWEQDLFGCQPSLLLCQTLNSPVVSELLTMGYVSYYPLFVALSLYCFFWRYEQFERVTFFILTSFFLFYVVFMFLPVAGPQFYFKAAGTDNIAAGIFPNLTDYFGTLPFDVLNPQYVLPLPGWHDGFFYHVLEFTHNAGERPTGAFPSSHVGVTVVVMWLAWDLRNRWLFAAFLPFAVLMFFATFYLQAHYVIDAIAGLAAGTLVYFLLCRVYQRITTKTSLI